MREWLKWFFAKEEMYELSRIKSTIINYNRWLAEFDDICLVLDGILDDRNISMLRDKVRKIRGTNEKT